MADNDTQKAPTSTGHEQQVLPAVEAACPTPERIGRYRIEGVLGKGGFGIVYLAYDEQLGRKVAIKVPHAHLISCGDDAELYLTEARTVANLDSPHIVPVLDIGSTADFPVFVVSKYIEGSDLATTLKRCRLSHRQVAELVATVAESLHYAHKQGLVHRDIKPGNILIDKDAKPFIVDFGLAQREENAGKGAKYLGTPAYMSPEQARDEGHRVDGRSDIFSLAVVLYELLVARRPFRGETSIELLEAIAKHEPKPPRQIDENIPKELDRICLKALSKRASERYSTAKDMADDLRHFLTHHSDPTTSVVAPSITSVVQPHPTLKGTETSTTPATDNQPIKIVPKGLRSFDAHDADFFLDLLPGPRDRDGLPDSIRFWKTRIEETDPDETFSMGLIYGPSGCGKSSLVKAGLLPRLSVNVIAVYVEATAEETETRLLNGLRKRCPTLPDNLSLKETLAALRRGQGIPVGKKIVIVLDQFEQWLHAKKDVQNTELVQALRQCDGGRLHCIVMVRDDFWLSVSRFLRELEVKLLEGQNSALADLFDVDHAKKVLAAFGRAFGKLPELGRDTSKDQTDFLNQAVSGLAQEGKVISVRLALFAEMMKGKTWTPATLSEVGGTEGVGVTFLEETFNAATAPPEHRYHQQAAKAVLKSLLPEFGTDIKGHMRSYIELLDASGYRSRPKDFDNLIHILDSEIRLITPTDPEGQDESSDTSQKPGEKYFQLTHDYLVPSLRDWLTRKQKETRRGRAELSLADRTVVWTVRPERRQLPPLWQWLSILWFVPNKSWTPPQRKMMRAAGRHRVMQTGVLATVMAGVVAIGWTIQEQRIEERRQAADRENVTKAEGLVKSLLKAETAKVPDIIKEMVEYRRWVDPLLKEENDKAAMQSRQKLLTSLALLPDNTQVDYLYGRLLAAEPDEIGVIRDALDFRKDHVTEGLWKVLAPPTVGREQQVLCAAAALAKYSPSDDRWNAYRNDVAEKLVAVSPFFIKYWTEALREVRERLVPPLAEICKDWGRESSQRFLVAQILVDYAADRPEVLADLLMDADEKQFVVIFPKLKERASQALPILISEIDKKLPDDLPSSDESREKLAKRQANAGVALLRLDQQKKVWPLFQHSPDPRVRSYVTHRMGPLSVDPTMIIKHLDAETDITRLRALVLSLGEFNEQALSPEQRSNLMPKLKSMYRTHPDPGLHGAAEWLLRTWKQDEWLKQVQNEFKDEPRLADIQKQLAKPAMSTTRLPQWYVNSQGQTLVVIPGPVEFDMGSPEKEVTRQSFEHQHRRRVGRTFAVGATAVTLEKFREFDKEYGEQGEGFEAGWIRQGDLPVVAVDWFTGVKYCDWLSQQEKLDSCYEIEGEKITLKENYLSLNGYRFPTEAESEYATRAGVVTSRYFGETDELLGKYAWYFKNSNELMQPVGLLKPNDFGFFDIHGNVYCWCQDEYLTYPEGDQIIEDKEGGLSITPEEVRMLRGGSFSNPPSFVRSAFRVKLVPRTRLFFISFRLARTLPQVPLTALPLSPEVATP